jgi:hypothetical protein
MPDESGLSLSSPDDLSRTKAAVDALAWASALEHKTYMDRQLDPFLNARVSPLEGNIISVDVTTKTCTFGDHEGNIQDATIALPARFIKPDKMEGHTALFLFRWSDQTWWFDMMTS